MAEAVVHVWLVDREKMLECGGPGTRAPRRKHRFVF